MNIYKILTPEQKLDIAKETGCTIAYVNRVLAGETKERSVLANKIKDLATSILKKNTNEFKKVLE